MFSQQDFIARLQRIMNYYDLNASALADSLGVLRSSISHLLSERNKPSLDFVLKIVDKYPEVDLYWLLYGKGTFPKEEKKAAPTPLPTEIPFPQANILENSTKEIPLATELPVKNEKKQIQKIIFFYEDNSFEIFENL
ncbi:helix-turn-helix transcriptional regulator [Capnocytophaga gingivalis]|uniref:Helix-turn-helix transcriptional regulator n=1 Tax=Capnocytophaga gingivalis TaxID=1017 RepID=A0ABU5Z799_9FLAO|nr:helix-turn-helix transcriptional regulator [Capnocytophaga gingivalis]MEB3074836.1 helix-turn-helix transcriptional regulator [Capnocytophaga gingivalis]